MKPVAAAARIEPAHDILRSRRHPLDAFFQPESVALIGATEAPGSVGRTVLWNLLSNPFGGTVFPVNPKRPSVLGIKAYPGIGSVPESVDLAVIATPARTVPGVIAECARAGVAAAIIISAGFKERGPEGVELERQILEIARRSRMRIIGPNCLGLMSPVHGLNATFAGAMAHAGTVGFVSQSGALCTSILDWSLQEMVGFSAFISVGSMLDVGWGDLIDYLGEDPRTRSIILYMESVGDPRRFLSAARQVALSKPIIVIKAGRSEAAAKAAASHTGALTGSDAVLDAAFRRSGVLRVDRVSDLFHMAQVLAKQPRPRGPRLAILTNAGGPGVLAADALVGYECELAELSEETITQLSGFLPPHWSHADPVDILGDADAERYARTIEVVSRDAGSDGLLVVLSPQGMTDPAQVAEKVKPYARLEGKPILASWMGGTQVAAGESILNRAGIPTFPYPDTAVRAFHYMWRYSYNLRGLYETPQLVDGLAGGVPDHALAAQTLEAARHSGRTLLTEFESKQVLRAYGIPVAETRLAANEAEAVRAAGEIGYPVVLKLNSYTITHKTDVGGVQLNLADEAGVRGAWRSIQGSVGAKAGEAAFQGVTVQPMVKLDGYEVILGSTVDSQFGPVLLFGAGGQLVEVFEDRALALPPLSTTLARRMMEQTRIFKALQGVRGRPPADLNALERLLVAFSQLIVEQRWIRETDINPLLVSPSGVLALDARVVLYGPETREEELPRTAIRPYPTQYVSTTTLKDGRRCTVRPIRPEDEPLMVAFHQNLSEETVYMRYFHALPLGARVAHERLTGICFIDYDRQIVLVAESQPDDQNAQGGARREIMAVGRLNRLQDSHEAEMAVLVSDRFQNLGLGTELVRRLLDVGRAEHVTRVSAELLAQNARMQRICQKVGFELSYRRDDSTLAATLKLA